MAEQWNPVTTPRARKKNRCMQRSRGSSACFTPLLVLIVVAGCGEATGPGPEPEPPATPMGLDAEFVEVALEVPGFGGLFMRRSICSGSMAAICAVFHRQAASYLEGL
jgi:hypothetical protein